ncbi:MAG: DUF503 domain-containing protein [Calditrichaceae bacterium]|nr:DUF503 domain-containing protein [Calditrichia bacterium]NUQ43269.1 DUF503 domain-containing protein [Calditrichaceae bacterium]
MIVAVLTVELYLPGSASLKDKRAILRQLKDRLANKFNISIAEVDHQDKWQRAQLGIAQVGNDYKFLEKSMNTILQVIDENDAAEVTEHLIEYL